MFTMCRQIHRIHRAFAVLVAGALLAAPTAVHAQDARLAAITDADARANIGALIVEAERMGLPREPLVTKALEGVEKRATGPRIEAAVRAMAKRLADARVALTASATPSELKAGADALSAGVSPDAIRIVRLASPRQSTAVALGVLAQLCARGVPADRAAIAVTTMMKRGASDMQMLALQRAVQDDLAVGIPPGNALDLRSHALIATLPPPTPPGSTTGSTLAPPGATTTKP